MVADSDPDENRSSDQNGSRHDHADVRYLDAKQSVDDRARNRRVAETLRAECPASPSVFDAGCGTGVTLDLLREWGVDPAAYHGVDQDEGLIEVARERAAVSAGGVDGNADTPTVEFTAGDAVAAAEAVAERRPPTDRPDLLVAQSFLDLVPVADALAAFENAVAPGGLLYAPLTFDGVTTFQPSHPADAAVERRYHESIDAVAGRDTHAGRRAVATLQQAPGELLAVGGSDWVVRPRSSSAAGDSASGDDSTAGDDSPAAVDSTAGGSYPADERYFLDRILGYVAGSVLDTDVHRISTLDASVIDTAAVTVETGERGVDSESIRDWLHTRRRQLRDGVVSYFTHQFDILYRTPSGDPDDRAG